MPYFPHPAFLMTGGLTSLTQILSASGTQTATVAVPSGVQAGDLLVFCDLAFDAAAPAAVTPSGFTNVVNTTSTNYRYMISYKIALGTESGTNITGTAVANKNDKALVIWRGDAPVSLVSAADSAFQAITTAPTNQVVDASAGLAPLIVLAMYACSASPVDVRGFSPAKDGEVAAHVDEFWFAWKTYNLSPANVTISMADEGALNALGSLYLAVS
jgi:hypothetical protein